jgi:ABC-type dipeptide/oligopeptide/nickel transport system permease component
LLHNANFGVTITTFKLVANLISSTFGVTFKLVVVDLLFNNLEV